MKELRERVASLISDLRQFSIELSSFLIKGLRLQFLRFETGKGVFVTALYRQRGKLARRLIHSGMAGITAFGVMVAPIVAQEFPGDEVDPWEATSPSSVLSISTQDPATLTVVSAKARDKIIEYKVQDGDTVGSIAEKFGISEETIRWQNNLSGDKIKVGQALEILPVTGISRKVRKGDTVYSIAKRYDVDPQEIVNFPFNSYMNDETFELAIGQAIIVPDGVMPTATGAPTRTRQITPDAGTVVASGQFVWPTSGKITQRFVWYHKGIDIANRSAPNILAADSGTVTYVGCIKWAYGCHIRLDHGNGFKTLYAHLSSIYVNVGQTVVRGNAIGKMGSSGRSTGVHLHFEVIRNGVYLNPLSVLK